MTTLPLAIDADAARDDAREILTDRRFQPETAPRPLRGLLEWIGDRLRDLAEAIGRLLEVVPGPTWLALVLVAAALTALAVSRLVRRRSGGRVAARSAARSGAARADDAAALEQQARDAEQRGDLDLALRLRFRAGLLRLDERGAIRFRPSLTTTEVRQLLGSESFDELARRFEEVAYGGRHAGEPDLETARAEWRRLVREAKPRGTP